MPLKVFQPSTLLLAQDVFFRNLGKLRALIAMAHPEWILTISECGVARDRTGKPKLNDGPTSGYTDAVHMGTSHHYERLACDLNLFVLTQDGSYGYIAITASDAPQWQEIHHLWLGLDKLNRVMPMCGNDANHLARAVDASDPRI